MPKAFVHASRRIPIIDYEVAGALDFKFTFLKKAVTELLAFLGDLHDRSSDNSDLCELEAG